MVDRGSCHELVLVIGAGFMSLGMYYKSNMSFRNRNLQDDILKKMLTVMKGVGESPPHLGFGVLQGRHKTRHLSPANKKAEEAPPVDNSH